MWYGVGKIILALCCGSGIDRGHATLFCAYVGTVNGCHVSFGANECLHW